jgi:hypothetical protein
MEQLISNGEMFQPAFTKRDKKQKGLRGISTKWFKKPVMSLYKAS